MGTNKLPHCPRSIVNIVKSIAFYIIQYNRDNIQQCNPAQCTKIQCNIMTLLRNITPQIKLQKNTGNCCFDHGIYDFYSTMFVILPVHLLRFFLFHSLGKLLPPPNCHAGWPSLTIQHLEEKCKSSSHRVLR